MNSRAQIRRDVVEDVVDAGCNAAEIDVFVVFIANHGIEGIGRPIDDSQGQAADGKEEQRRHDAVNGIFGNRFHRSPRHFRAVEMVRIAADDLADLQLSNAQMMTDEISVDFPAGLGQAAGQIMKDKRMPWMI